MAHLKFRGPRILSQEDGPMAQETQTLTGSGIRFSNGTTIEGLAGTGSITQNRPISGRLRGPAERDTSPQFDAYDIQGGASDTVSLQPAPSGAAGSLQLAMYQDESGGISWHFPTKETAS